MSIKRISSFLSVSPQIYPGHVQKIASLGFKTIINNRPDGETDNQPLAHELAAEAVKNGIVFINQPVISGKVTATDAANFAAELKRVRGPVLAFCRTGMRCTTLWALNQARFTDPGDVMKFAAAIGFDLKDQRENLQQAAALSNRAQKP